MAKVEREMKRAITPIGGHLKEDILPALGLDFDKAVGIVGIAHDRFRDFMEGHVDLTEAEAKKVEQHFQLGAEMILKSQKSGAAHKAQHPEYY